LIKILLTAKNFQKLENCLHCFERFITFHVKQQITDDSYLLAFNRYLLLSVIRSCSQPVEFSVVGLDIARNDANFYTHKNLLTQPKFHTRYWYACEFLWLKFADLILWRHFYFKFFSNGKKKCPKWVFCLPCKLLCVAVSGN
jgi:hypothetical protein